MELKDYYAIMGVERTDSLKTIKTAYRRLARKYHPDVSKESDAEARFKEIAEAWEVLSDEERRAEYDEQWKHRNDPRFGQYGRQGQQNQQYHSQEDLKSKLRYSLKIHWKLISALSALNYLSMICLDAWYRKRPKRSMSPFRLVWLTGNEFV